MVCRLLWLVLRRCLGKDYYYISVDFYSYQLTRINYLKSVCFWGYDLGKNLMSMASGNSKKDLTLTHLAIAGGISALPATALMTPIERVKCLLQVQDSSTTGRKFTGPVDVVKTLYREGGIRSIYKGTGATLLRDIPGSMAYFGGYEVFKKMLTPKGSRPEDLSPLATLVAGGMAGIANWSVAIVSIFILFITITLSRYP